MSPISSPSLDSPAALPAAQLGAAAPITVEAEGTSAPRANWLLTWLAQTEIAAKTATALQQVQWLTLLPSVPVFQDLLAPLAMDGITQDEIEIDEEDIGEVAVETPQLGAAAPIAVEAEDTSAPRANWLLTWLAQTEIAAKTATALQQVQWLTLLPSVPVFQDLLAPLAMDEITQDEIEIDEEDIGEVAGETPIALVPIIPASQGPAVAAIAASTKALQSEAIQQRGEPPAQPLAAQPDKGELIWAADFVVAEKAAPLRIAVAPSGLAGGQQPADEQSPDRPQGESAAIEAPASPAETFEPPVLEIVPQGTTKVELKSLAAAPEPTGLPVIGNVEPDTPRPLRPSQIATLYVDLPAPGPEADAGTIRLAVSQRGDQVNVRLRSWDAGAAPIENDRMQPLLQSLAEQGYAASNGSNDQQPPQNADGGQRNQERQQQAFLLRRQLKNLNTDQFDLQAQIEGFGNAQQQGVFR